MTKKKRALTATLVTLGLFVASCGGDDAAEPAAEAPAEEADEVNMTPGEGVSVTMAKADWSTEDPNAYVAHLLLAELGYDVSDPKDLELGPSNAYIAMAQGDADFWINSWYPGHNSWLANELPDGSLIGDHVSPLGEMMMAGGLQGYLITKSFAEEYGITSLDDFNSNADAIAAYDAGDPDPGNGIADIYGCSESWTCDDIIQSQIAFSGWENIKQTIAGYDAMFAEAVTKADAGEPAIVYTWTPSAYITQLRPGDNVLWLEVDNVIDDSNPLGVEGGEGHNQLPGTASIGEDQCPGSEGGVCQLGWVAADIQVSANNDWLAANPAAAALLELFKMSVIDVSLMNVEMAEGTAVLDLAQGWIADNRAQVDEWLDAARAAARSVQT
ncbi:MAG TPA: proline/glycine betaine ABC transporter substrate-binding protein ProX, partial [Acidimicrobiaceae bacterium]|nr:proline/glycine betaine ABC transporter substrate-binding protein ProX [Acidimicrobiaceae bacterium]